MALKIRIIVIFQNFIMKTKMLFFISSFLLLSCNDISVETQYFPFRESPNSNWGFIAPNGDTLLANTFSEKPSCVINSLFVLQDDNGYFDLYNIEEGKFVAEDFEQICLFSEKVTPAIRKGGNYIELINLEGKTSLKLKEVAGMRVVSCSTFKYGKAVVHFEDGSCGCIDVEGRLVVAPDYCYLSNLSENIWIAVEKEYGSVNDENFRFTFLSNEGKVISHLKVDKYEELNFAGGEFMPFKTEDGWGIIDTKGNVVVAPKYSYIKDISVEYNKVKNFVFLDDCGWGVMSGNEDIIIDSKYEYLSIVDDNTLIAKSAKSDYCKLIDYSEKQIGTSRFRDYYLEFFGNGAFSMISDDCYGILTKQGEYLKNCPDIYEVDTDEGLTCVSLILDDKETDHYDEPDTLYINNIPITMMPVANGENSFYIQKTTVTQDLWTAVMGFNNSEVIGNRYPVTNVSWYNCVDFVEKLSKRTGLAFSLPTEEEWLLAASNGEDFVYSGSNDINKVGWCASNSSGQIHPVAQLHPNSLGLYDMTGNVWEWCWNVCTNNSQVHAVRGGGWATSGEENLNIRHHDSYITNLGSKYHGFRLKLKTKTPLSRRTLEEHCDSLVIR